MEDASTAIDEQASTFQSQFRTVRDEISKIIVGYRPAVEDNGASPRGAQALIVGGKIKPLLNGRQEVRCEDIRSVALPALRHRIILNFEGEAERVDSDSIIESILNDTPERC